MMRTLTTLLLVALSTSRAFCADVDLASARQSLQNYGLGHCLSNPFKEESEMSRDLARSVAAYSFMGLGVHEIVQNEDTLEVLHDPYRATRDYVVQAYEKTPASSKHSDRKMTFHACMTVFNSPQYHAFIASQDRYLPESIRAPRLETVARCDLDGTTHTLKLLRGSEIQDSHLYSLGDAHKTWPLFDTLEDSRGSNVRWQCVAIGPGTKALVFSGEFTANYLQGAAFYLNRKTGQVERIDFAERNRPRWLKITGQGPRVIFENVGHESTHPYLVYGANDDYQELDELPRDASRADQGLVELMNSAY